MASRIVVRTRCSEHCPSSANALDEAPKRLFGRQRPIHSILGGGKVADVLLWREKRVSGAILIGTAIVWLLFEVAEYNLITLLCHLTITTMLFIFIWSSAAKFFNWNPPNVWHMVLEDSDWRDVVSTFCKKFNDLLAAILQAASGYDPKLFLQTVVSLWMISIIGSLISSFNLLCFGIVCLETFPFLYEQYEDEVDNLAYEVNKKVKKMYQKFDAEILGKIPRGSVKDKDS